MFLALLMSCAMLGADDKPSTADPSAKPAIETYQAERAKAGKNADAHVRLALWCEAHALSAERMQQLALAVLYDPSNALARGLMGMVAYQGKWGRPEVVGQQIQNDPANLALIREYLDRRAKTASKAEAQLRLAAWCDQKGLKEQALAHYNEVIRLDPSREVAWRHLGYKKLGHRWIKPEEAAAQKRDAEHQKQADKHWKSKLERLREGLTSKDLARRAKAEQELAEVTDPRAIPMIWALFLRGSERLQIAAIQMLSQIDGPAASNALAVLAVINPSAEVRRRATERLVRRDPRDVVGRLIGLIRKPFKYQVRPVNGPGTTGELFVEGEKFKVQSLYNFTPIEPGVLPSRFFAPSIPFDPYNFQNLVMAAVASGSVQVAMSSPAMTPQAASQAGRAMAANPRNAPALMNGQVNNPANGAITPVNNFLFWNQALAAQQDLQVARALEIVQQRGQALEQVLARDIQSVEMTNANIKLLDSRALPILTEMTGQDLGVEPEKWRAWWTDQLGYAYQSSIPETKPTFTQFVSSEQIVLHSACFAAGTPVQTINGPRAIESIQVGDRVLSQNTSTGLLAFQPVMMIHRNQPAQTLRIAIGDETIVATGIHRFWKAGKGWTMARELKPGDRLRIVDGVTEVRSIENDKAQPVYNLDVAGNRNFFAGAKGLLVHDFSFVQPVAEPFDRQPDLEAQPASEQ